MEVVARREDRRVALVTPPAGVGASSIAVTPSVAAAATAFRARGLLGVAGAECSAAAAAATSAAGLGTKLRGFSGAFVGVC